MSYALKWNTNASDHIVQHKERALRNYVFGSYAIARFPMASCDVANNALEHLSASVVSNLMQFLITFPTHFVARSKEIRNHQSFHHPPGFMVGLSAPSDLTVAAVVTSQSRDALCRAHTSRNKSHICMLIGPGVERAALSSGGGDAAR